jgi:hypothetical protein
VNRWPACGVLSYDIVFSIFLYAIGFVGHVWVPKSIESARAARRCIADRRGTARPVRDGIADNAI